jgi:hypothetical protein
MFRHAPIPWNLLLHMGIRIILRKYNIKNGVLVTDDTDPASNAKATALPISKRAKRVPMKEFSSQAQIVKSSQKTA